MTWVIMLLIATPPPAAPPDPTGQVEFSPVLFQPCRSYEKRFGPFFAGRWTACVTEARTRVEGLRPNDHVIRLNGTPIDQPTDFYAAWFRLRPGAKVEMLVVRGVRPLTVTYTVREHGKEER